MALMAALDFTAWHLSQARATRQTPGWPDMLFTSRARRLAVYYEAKSSIGKQSPAQKPSQGEIEGTGGTYVAGPAEVLGQWCAARGLLRILPPGGYVVLRPAP